MPSGTGGHARTEAMGAFTVKVARLIGALHAESRSAKTALKQAHGGSKRRAARVRSDFLSVKRTMYENRNEFAGLDLWITLSGRV